MLNNKNILLITFLMFCLRLFLILQFPLTNDESYYWAWTQNLQLSYLDHPPGVSWLAWLCSLLGKNYFSLRIGPMILHLASSILLFYISKIVHPTNTRIPLITFFLAQTLPAFQLWGIFLLPDPGLVFFITLTTLLGLKTVTLYHNASTTQAYKLLHWVALGLAIGGSGLFKYHAAPTCLGILLFLIVNLWKKMKHDFLLVIICCTVSIIVTSPIIIWNYQNDWASFIFQSSHGFSNSSPKFSNLVRTAFSHLIFYTPGIYYLFIKDIFNSHNDVKSRIFKYAALPVFVLIYFSGISNKTLPHWVLISFWIYLPLLADLISNSPKITKVAITPFAILTLIVSIFIATPTTRNKLLDSFDDNPKGLSELTIWDEVYTQEIESILSTEQSNPKCKNTVFIAGLRWFWVSQMLYRAPTGAVALNFDANRMSYFHMADNGANWVDCRMLIFGNKAHFNHEKLAEIFDIEKIDYFSVNKHKKIALVKVQGVLKKPIKISNWSY